MEQKLIDDIRQARADVAVGQRTPSALVDRLCDEASFQEYGLLTRLSSDEDQGRLVAGVGRLNGHAAVIVSNEDAPSSAVNQAKLDRLIAHAVDKAWPFVYLATSGQTSDHGRAGELDEGRGLALGGGRIGLFDGLCELSGLMPTVAVISGAALDQDAAIAMFADFVVATAGSVIGLAGTGVRAVEIAEDQGDIDLVVPDELAAIRAVREYLDYVLEDRESGASSVTSAQIADVVPEDRRRAYDMREVIGAIADADNVLELRPNWGPSLITSLVRLDGRTVGVFANQPKSRIAGAIDATAADKMCRFIEFCDAYSIPLLSLIDSPGFYIGKDAERGGIARHHVRTLSAIEHRDVPLYCVQIRKAYGLGPLVMRGSWGHLPPELRLAWPTVETGGMSLEGAAYLVRRKEIQAAKTPAEARAIRDEYASTLRARESGVRAGQSFSFDDIILPAETRDRIIAMLDLSPRTRRSSKKTYLDTI